MKNFLAIVILNFVTFHNLIYGQTFSPFPNNPVIPLTQPNPGVWNDPCVLKMNDEYWMYATSPNGKNNPFEGNVLPYLMKSSDGIKWKLNDSLPLLLNNNDPEAWDSKGIETPSVIFFNSLFHMYYSAIPKKGETGQAAIGHATSTDGKIWSRDKIILTPSGIATDWKSYAVAEPGAVVYRNKVYLYFTGIGARQETNYPAGQSVIGLSVSDDGYTFSEPQKVLTQGNLYPPSMSYYGYSTPSAVVIDQHIHLYYDVVLENPQWHQTALHHAYSPDGATSFTEDLSAIFEKTDFSWTAREIRSPSVLLDSSKVKMWFAGDDINTGKFGIGYAFSDVPVTAIEEATVSNQVHLYPNPTSNSFTIQTSVNLKQASCLLYDCFGRLVKETKDISGHTFILDRNQLNSGLYLVRIVEEGNVIIEETIIFRDE